MWFSESVVFPGLSGVYIYIAKYHSRNFWVNTTMRPAAWGGIYDKWLLQLLTWQKMNTFPYRCSYSCQNMNLIRANWATGVDDSNTSFPVILPGMQRYLSVLKFYLTLWIYTISYFDLNPSDKSSCPTKLCFKLSSFKKENVLEE